MTLTTAEIAKLLAGEVLGDANATLTGFATADAAKPGDLTFAETDEFFTAAENSAATAIIAGKNSVFAKKIIIRVEHPRMAFAKALAVFFPEPKFTTGIHPPGVVAAPRRSTRPRTSARIAYWRTRADRRERGFARRQFHRRRFRARRRRQFFPNVTIYPRTQIGRRVRIHAGTVIGSDGFGYVFDAGFHRKVPQIGNVIIGDDVEIGANVTVDRGALGSTVIGKGTKIDNLVQVAHNVQIGEHCILCAQVGIAGSAKLGNYCVLAGQVGIAGHLKIGNQVTIGSKAGVMHNIPDGEQWLGIPAQPDKQAKRIMIAMQRLPDLFKKIAEWEKKLGVKPE